MVVPEAPEGHVSAVERHVPMTAGASSSSDQGAVREERTEEGSEERSGRGASQWRQCTPPSADIVSLRVAMLADS